MPLPDPGISAANGLTKPLTRAIMPRPNPALPPGPVNSNPGPDQLAALCASLSPGIPLLALAYPEFTISQPGPGRNGPTWTAIRKDPAQPGLYAAVTPDLAELRDILARHASHPPDGSNPAT